MPRGSRTGLYVALGALLGAVGAETALEQLSGGAANYPRSVHLLFGVYLVIGAIGLFLWYWLMATLGARSTRPSVPVHGGLALVLACVVAAACQYAYASSRPSINFVLAALAACHPFLTALVVSRMAARGSAA